MNNAPITRPSLLARLRDVEDAEAWREFVRLYTPLVFGHCARHGLQEADAADVAQEVMRIAAQTMPDFEYDARRGKFRGWLLQTTRHRLHKFLKFCRRPWRQMRSPVRISSVKIERRRQSFTTTSCRFMRSMNATGFLFLSRLATISSLPKCL